MMRSIKKHYHWVIAVVAIIQMLIYGGAVNNFSGYHMIPVTTELGISRTAFSFAESIRSIVAVASTFCSGFLIQRFGYRKTTSVGLLLACAAYALYSSMKAYWMLIAGCIMMGIAHGVCFVAGVSRIVNSWFQKCRGIILGLVTAATGVGSTLLGTIQAPLVERISWRASFTAVSGLQLLLAILVFLLVRNQPENVGLRPYEGSGKDDPKKKIRHDAWEGFSLAYLKKRPSYYMLCACAFLSCLCVLATQYNLVPFFQDCGMSVTRTSKLYGTMMLALGILKLLMGMLCDAIGAKRVLLLCHLACAGGLAMVLLLPQTDAAMISALVVYDLSIPLTTMMFPLVSADLFGTRSQTQYIGTIMSMTIAGNIVSGPLANVVYDNMGSYRPVFWFCVCAALLMIPVYGLLYKMVQRDRKAAMKLN